MSEKRKESIKPSIIAVIVLVVIALISGALLSILNDLLSISEDEKVAKELNAVYPSPTYEKIEIIEELQINEKYGGVRYIYRAEDGAIIIKTQGVKGYKGNSEILMAVKDKKIVNVYISSFGGDNITSTVNEEYLLQYRVDITEDLVFYLPYLKQSGDVDVSAGATSKKTMNSVCAAANMAVYYLNKSGLLGGVTQ